jgi:hypothetical protein
VAGLACVLDDQDRDGDGELAASCRDDLSAGPAGAACTTDDDCRDRTCALGHCVDVCATDRDCADGQRCTEVPRVEVAGAPLFQGCVPASGSLTWRLPVDAPREEVLVPVPAAARSLVLSMSIDAPGQRVGALSVHTPPAASAGTAPRSTRAEFFDNLVRHTPRERRSFLELPGSPRPGLRTRRVPDHRQLVPRARSTRHRHAERCGRPSSSTTATCSTCASCSSIWTTHACQAAMGGPLDALRAEEAPFQDYLTSLGQLLARAGIDLRQSSFIDLRDRPEFDSLTAAELPQLLAAGPAGPALNIYFVRTIEPIGTAALIESTPGAPLDVGSGPGGVAIALDTLCYRAVDHAGTDHRPTRSRAISAWRATASPAASSTPSPTPTGRPAT